MKYTLGTVILFVVGIGILGGVARFIYKTTGPESGYKAVLLTSGDVYFAKVDDSYGRYVTLSHIYYPQVSQAGEGAQPDIRLVKFGNEVHGPEDEIRVNREHIIMIQPLRPDSQVIASIDDYENGQ